MRIIILPILILALSLAACGGDDTGKKFAADVNTIQTTVADTVNNQAASGHLNAGEIASVVNSAANKIATLKAPKNAEGPRTSLVRSLHSYADTLGNNPDPASFKTATQTYSRLVSEEIKTLNRSF